MEPLDTCSLPGPGALIKETKPLIIYLLSRVHCPKHHPCEERLGLGKQGQPASPSGFWDKGLADGRSGDIITLLVMGIQPKAFCMWHRPLNDWPAPTKKDTSLNMSVSIHSWAHLLFQITLYLLACWIFLNTVNIKKFFFHRWCQSVLRLELTVCLFCVFYSKRQGKWEIGWYKNQQR